MPDFIEPDELQFATERMAQVFALNRFHAVFLFPGADDASARERNNVQAQLGMAHIRNSPSPITGGARATRLAHEAWSRVLIQPFASLDLADAKGEAYYRTALAARLKKWEPVGLALRQLWPATAFHNQEFRGGATVSKLLGTAAQANGLHESGVQRYWAQAKPVAHLLTALVHINHVLPKRSSIFPTPAEFVPMLNVARHWQRFLTTAPAANSQFGKSSLPLSSDDMWLIADGGYPKLLIPERPMELEAMAPEAVEQIKNRKAPIAGR